MSYAIGREHPQAPRSPYRGMAFHHIIPRSILIQAFNRLLEDHIQSAAAETRACLFQFLALCKRRYTAQEKMVGRLRSDPSAPGRAGHNPLAPLNTHELTAIHRPVIWPDGDFVEGPANIYRGFYARRDAADARHRVPVSSFAKCDQGGR